MIDVEGPWAPLARAAAGPWLLGAENEDASAVDFANTVGGEDRFVPRGYGALVTAYGDGLPVRLGTPATRVRAGAGGVRVATPAGEVRARAAIVTVPLGVLAAETIRFEPPLPLDAVRAVEGLPMGLLAKVGLRFKGDPFGLGDTFYLHYRAPTERAVLFVIRPAGLDLTVGLFGGAVARELEAAGAEAATAFVLEPLLAIFGTALRRRLVASVHTRWGADPWARGAYAAARPGCAGRRALLSRPVHDRIWFAGEACAADGWAATVAGAFLTGRDAARRVARRLA
ncbi:MAG TPA: FAD-dependent oxidoreductase [Geminicoccaceae bacterium]|nr:FAD-dependent oxidoreductase [Geminicoccaceae bacterium]